MFPLILLLLIRTLSAAEFPALTKNIRMSWNGTEVTQSLDGSRTVRYDDQVPAFTLCGKFDSQRKDADCEIRYSQERKTPSSWSRYSSSTFGKARFISQDNSQGYEYSCMKFDNPIQYFPIYYNAEASGQGSWSVTYVCPVDSAWTWIIGFVVVFLLILFGTLACILRSNPKNKDGQYAYASYNEDTVY